MSLSLGLLVLLASHIATTAKSAPDEALARQKEALDVIQEFADNFCKTIPESGQNKSVEASVKAQAQLGALLSKLGDLRFEGAAKYESDEWQGPLRESLAAMVKDNQNCRLYIWRDLQTKLIKTTESFNTPRLVKLLCSHDKKYLKLEAIIQNDSDRDYFVTRFTVGNGYDYSEKMAITMCCPYCMLEETFVFDRLVSLVSTSWLPTDKFRQTKSDLYDSLFQAAAGRFRPRSHSAQCDRAKNLQSRPKPQCRGGLYELSR